MTSRSPGQWPGRFRSTTAALLVSLAVASAGCSQPSQAPEPLDVMAQLPEFTSGPAGATLVDEQRRSGCEDPGSGYSGPTVYRSYQLPPAAVQRTVRDLRSQWERAGWTTSPAAEPGSYTYTKRTAGGWSVLLTILGHAAGTLEISGTASGLEETCG